MAKYTDYAPRSRPINQRRFTVAELTQIHQLPDEALVDEGTAAAVMGQAGATMPNWRAKKIGPPWVKLTDAPNGPVRYQMGALRRYMRERTVQTAA